MKYGKYPVVTLCGSTRFKDEFYKVQKELTLKGVIVISVGLFGHSGDNEVWDGKDEDTLSSTKLMLDDMHKSKIDMADGIYVINPGGYIGESTWSEICYADMTGKHIDSLEPIDKSLISEKRNEHIKMAEVMAAQQFDVLCHQASDYPEGCLENTLVHIKVNGELIVDPWIPTDDEGVDIIEVDPFNGHKYNVDKYDPFERYGKKKMARFVEDILQKQREN